MIDKYPTIRKRLRICDSFPNAVFVNALRSYVYIYYLLEYGELNCSRYRYFSRILKNALLDFVNYNPSFGRLVFSNDNFIPSVNALSFNSNVF